MDDEAAGQAWPLFIGLAMGRWSIGFTHGVLIGLSFSYLFRARRRVSVCVYGKSMAQHCSEMHDACDTYVLTG